MNATFFNRLNITSNHTIKYWFEPNFINNFVIDPENFDAIISNANVQLIFIILYLIIFLLGIFGNALVVFVVLRNRQMQTVTNIFICNLAISDILLCILAVPFTPSYSFLKNWIFGEYLCHIVPFCQGISIYISTLTLTGIAVDRFLVILYPFRPRMKISLCIIIITSIWIFAFLLTLPYGMYMKYETKYENNEKINISKVLIF